MMHRLSKTFSWKTQKPSLNLQQLRSQSSALKPVDAQIKIVVRNSKAPISIFPSFTGIISAALVRAILIAMVVTVQNQSPVQSGEKFAMLKAVQRLWECLIEGVRKSIEEYGKFVPVVGVATASC
jgi:hypothetical protein